MRLSIYVMERWGLDFHQVEGIDQFGVTAAKGGIFGFAFGVGGPVTLTGGDKDERRGCYRGLEAVGLGHIKTVTAITSVKHPGFSPPATSKIICPLAGLVSRGANGVTELRQTMALLMHAHLAEGKALLKRMKLDSKLEARLDAQQKIQVKRVGASARAPVTPLPPLQVLRGLRTLTRPSHTHEASAH